MKSDTHLIIMAGGIGSRFWPLSTPELPKQFLDVMGTGRTLIQMTVARFAPICPAEHVWVVTNEAYVPLVKAQLPEIPHCNILAEPAARNTAPCIAYAGWKIKMSYPDANIVVAPSDAYVRDEDSFRSVISEALSFTRTHEGIVTVGIRPVRPETGYGYIQMADCDSSPYASGFQPSAAQPSAAQLSASQPSGSIALGSQPLGSMASGSIASDFTALGSQPLDSLPSKAHSLSSQSSGSIALGSQPLGSMASGSIASDFIALGSQPLGPMASGNIRSVAAFKEKPDRETACKYIEDGGYLWNAGIFVWNISTLESSIRTYAPDIAEGLDAMAVKFNTHEEGATLAEGFPKLRKISIDYAVMEHHPNVCTIPADFGWSDLGNWASLHALLPHDSEGNSAVGPVHFVECRNCIAHVQDSSRVVVQGLDDCIVSSRGGRILICRKSEEQRIKDW